MSRSFFSFARKLGFSLGPTEWATIGAVVVVGHGTYVYSTNHERCIYIKEKYMFTRDGYSELMIVDGLGNHYNVSNSIWMQKWDSLEDWYRLQKGDKIFIRYYGLRVPLLGLFPRVYYSKIEQ